ncbi:uncharacterized protein LOC122062578 isoform X2 [Macadamia integrifolia]|uniref:uncharacterized protein LOC122062578 isoform X2 n=1 Tax=Macadamia integrifolia TaxID=60698 RepID=UPI001C501D3D|nr:uncharacterized protein LOC122062578 isoform X2 [Macadamia integrifolia]
MRISSENRESLELVQIYQPDEVETVTVLPQTKEDKMKEYQMAAKRLDNARLSWKQKVDCSAQNPCKAQSNWIPSYTVWEKSDSLSIIRSHITVFHLFALIIESLRRLIKVDNDLRSPVTKDELVSEVVRQLCVDVQPENLHLPSPLTTMGEYEVPLRLPRAIPLPVGKLNWTLKVKIRRK